MAERLSQASEFSSQLEFLHTLSSQFSFATEMGAIAAAKTAGFGDKESSDRAAVEAMREYLKQVNINGRIVIGEGERDKAPMLFIGEKIGTGLGPEVDIAVDPLENTNAAAYFGPRSISVLAVSERDGLFHAPDMYMEKLVVGPEAKGKVDLDAPVRDNLKKLAKALHRRVSDLVVVVLGGEKRKRNFKIIDEIRNSGARVKLITDGDLMPAVLTCLDGSGIHALMGIGAAPEGVISAVGVKCLNGHMQSRFWLNPEDPEKNENDIKRLHDMGGCLDKIYTQDELASGRTLIFCASGVTEGDTLQGVRFFEGQSSRLGSLVISRMVLNGEVFLEFYKLDKVISYQPQKVKFQLF